MYRFSFCLLAVSLVGCDSTVCENAPTNIEAPGVRCAPNSEGGLSEALELRYVYERDERPIPSADFGCHFTTDGQTLTLVPDGEVCHIVRDPQTVTGASVAFVTRRCVPPAGTWFMSTGDGQLKVTVADGGVRCER